MTTTTHTADEFTAALNAYVAALNTASVAYFAAKFPTLKPNAYSIDPGGRAFVRVVCSTMDHRGGVNQRMVHVFVERATGKIWKAASWKGPARNFTRGDIFAPEYGNPGTDVLRIGR